MDIGHKPVTIEAHLADDEGMLETRMSIWSYFVLNGLCYKALEKRQLVAVVDGDNRRWYCESRFIILFSDSLRSAGKEKRLKERQLHSRRRESQEAKRLDAELQNQTNTLQSDMKGFAEIWNMVIASESLLLINFLMGHFSTDRRWHMFHHAATELDSRERESSAGSSTPVHHLFRESTYLKVTALLSQAFVSTRAVRWFDGSPWSIRVCSVGRKGRIPRSWMVTPASKDVRKDVQGCLRRLTRRPVLYRNFPDINLKWRIFRLCLWNMSVNQGGSRMSLLVYFHSNGKQASLSNSNQWYVCMYDSIQEETS